MSILLLGGTGLLGTELQKHMEFCAPSHKELDILEPELWEQWDSFVDIEEFDLVIHCAGFTKVEKAEKNRLECFDVNVKGTLTLLEHYKNIPFVYISSEYAYKPVNFYGLTKCLAEQLVTTHPNHLIIRTLFKPRPWKYDRAFKDAFTQGDYVDIIAPMIAEEILKWDKKSKLIYVGTGRKTIFELARRSKPDVIPNSIKEITNVKIPSDYL